MTSAFLEFVWLPTFERSAAGLLDETDRRELELAQDDLTDAERAELKELARIIKRGSG